MPVHKLVSYGFLYDGYSISRGLFWWEVLVLGRKCAVVALASFVSSQFVQVRRRSGGVTSACLTGLCFPSPQQMFLATILIVTALMLHLGLRPYESMSLHRLESVSLLVSALVSALALVSVLALVLDLVLALALMHNRRPEQQIVQLLQFQT